MAHGDALEGKWRGNRRMEWLAITLPPYPYIFNLWSTYLLKIIHSLPADPHTSTASSRLNWRTRRFKWTRPFPWKTKSGYCACAITFQTQSTYWGTQPPLQWVPAQPTIHRHLALNINKHRDYTSTACSPRFNSRPFDHKLTILLRSTCRVIWYVIPSVVLLTEHRRPCYMRFVPVHSVKAYEGVEVCLHASTSALYRDELYTHAASVPAREQRIILH